MKHPDGGMQMDEHDLECNVQLTQSVMLPRTCQKALTAEALYPVFTRTYHYLEHALPSSIPPIIVLSWTLILYQPMIASHFSCFLNVGKSFFSAYFIIITWSVIEFNCKFEKNEIISIKFVLRQFIIVDIHKIKWLDIYVTLL